MRISLMLHVLSAVVWVGGMFFAYMALRPAAVETLEPPQRLALWNATFRRFFHWVWGAVALLLGTGLHMLGVLGGMANAPLHAHLMLGLGILMMLIYGHVYFGPYRRLARAVAAADWKAGGAQLAKIRVLVGLNLSLGLLTIAIATFKPVAG